MPERYEVHVRGSLGPEMLHALADLDPLVSTDTTILRLDSADQPTLHGVLRHLYDLGLEIEAIRRGGLDRPA